MERIRASKGRLLTEPRLDGAEIDAATLSAWSIHLGRPVEDADSVREWLGEGTLPQAFAATARRMGSKPALTLSDGSITHAELDLSAGRMARELARLGAGPESPVLIGADTSLRSLIAYLGALRTGAPAVLANPTYTPAELARLGSESEAVIAMGSGEYLESLSKARLPTAELVGLHRDDRLTASVVLDDLVGEPAPVVPLDPDSAALYAFTSATTGRAKCVPLSHRNLLASIRGVMWAWRWTASDVLVHTLPIAHQHGLGGVHATLLAGSHAVLLGRLDSEELLSTVESGEPTVLFGVPTMYRRLLDDLGERMRAFRRLRLMTCGSAALSEELAGRIAELVEVIPLERYGSTEAGLDVSNPYEGQRIPGTVGLPLPGIEVAIVESEGRRLGPGEVGEVLLRGPQVFAGYRGMPAPEDPAFLFDWFRTGDVGLLEGKSGYLRLVGRTRDVMVTGGFNVYPKEVEAAIAAAPGVTDVAVIGVPSDRWGEEVTAFVVAPGGSTTEIMETAERSLAPFKRPKRLIFVDHIPRSDLGKVNREQLAKLDPIRHAPGPGI
jgi:malonyl-CoA/methylmalonyl-CoA synthetase